ncbi:MAG: Eco57I restriction-modification methylase domain-containing protein [Bacteroidales bacterium]|nr:Eco57I restriction-modification methylase domain-containing protein [Bacteroidales bacterium]
MANYITFKEVPLSENNSLFGNEPQEEQKIVLREEQQEAVKLAKTHFGKINNSGDFIPYPGFRQFLWNAKMRFGKTFCALQLAKEMDAKRVLIVTHRPVLDKSWKDDFKKIFSDRLDKYGFGTKFEREGDGEGNYYDLERLVKDGKGYIFFASMQYLRRSVLVGGDNDEQLKKDLLSTDWDLVVVDEAHEGTRTALGQKVINLLSKENTKILHLSGTPFNLYSDFKNQEIYTWDYIQEQQAKADWPIKHPGEKNPYEELPRMNIMTFSLGKLMDHFIEEGGSFRFTEFFRTWGGKDKEGNSVPKEKIGTFLHEKDVNDFLELLCSDSETSHYPFSTDEYRESFRHTLWIVPGVKEAAALEMLLKNHPVFGEENGFKVINVAGKSPEDEEKENALDRVINAIGKTPEDTYTITISCGRLTTGVTVKPWTAVFYMKGSEMTSAATYMQTIFRVQSPATIAGKMKTECYVFDFAPDRTLKMVAETAKFSSMAKEKAKKKKQDEDETQEERDRKTMKSFLELCPVISMDGGEMKPYEPRKLFEQLERVYIDRLVVTGFNDNSLYNVEELMNMDSASLNALGEKIAKSSNMEKPKNANPFKGGSAGFDQLSPEQKAAIEEARRKKREAARRGEKPQYTPEELAAIEAARKAREEAKKERENRISNIRGIALRIPLLMYGGADAGDPKEDLTVENFTRKIKDESWVEFMPRGITKKDFNDIRKCFNAARFEAAGKRYRALAKEADEMHVEDRVKRIADIFACFHNPDKETVLTPWRVVNLHMSDTLGGYCFYDDSFDNEHGRIDTPRYVGQGEISNQLFDAEDEHMEIPVKILEINSKTGLYPLYITYSFYRKRKDIYVRENLIEDPDNLSVEEEQVIWDDVLSNNVFVICNTPMPAQITKRTLLGFRVLSGDLNIRYEKLVEKASEEQNELVSRIKSKGFWNGTRNKEEMKFDAVVGNPPYQQKTTSAFQGVSIYNQFIDVARLLHPGYISMISPSRWMTKGSMGIKEEWVDMMLSSNHFIKIEDYIDFSEFFKNVGIGGGVNYFLYSDNYKGECQYTLHQNKKTYSRIQYLDELGAGVVVRDGIGASIVKKIAGIEGDYFNLANFSSLVGPLHFFDRDETLGTNWKGYSRVKDDKHPIKCYINKKLEDCGFGWIKLTDVAKSYETIDINKVF